MEDFKLLEEKFEILKEEEKHMLHLKMLGYTCQEISNMTKTNIRKVNYLFRKIKNL